MGIIVLNEDLEILNCKIDFLIINSKTQKDIFNTKEAADFLRIS